MRVRNLLVTDVHHRPLAADLAHFPENVLRLSSPWLVTLAMWPLSVPRRKRQHISQNTGGGPLRHEQLGWGGGFGGRE